MKKYSIMMITSEFAPFSKSGGLADMVNSLSVYLHKADHIVRIFTPWYSGLMFHEELLDKKIQKIEVPISFSSEPATIRKAILKDGIEVYFVNNPEYFDRAGLYGENNQSEYPDNYRRFAFFTRAAFEFASVFKIDVDIFHAHDWQAGLAASYLRRYRKEFPNAGSVFTIHNLGYQGIFSKHCLHTIGLEREDFQTEPTLVNQINYMKSALLLSDELTTVSPTYAKEIQTDAYGCGLQDILKANSNRLIGILNGMDYESWNPQNDKYISKNFSSSNFSGKSECKKALLAEFGLLDLQKPLIGMVSRMARQKGFHLLCGQGGKLAQILKDFSVNIIIIGTGDPWCESALNEISAQNSNLKIKAVFSEKMAHMIEAGSDFFLMPSEYEPCGLNQMYSLRYGTLPIVRKTGGLADTITDMAVPGGNGFVFDNSSPDELYETIGRAVDFYLNSKEEFEKARIQAMESRFTWENSAVHYTEAYRKALESRKIDL